MRGAVMVSAFFLATAGALPLVAAPAPATSEAAKTAARAKVQEGAALFEQGDLQGALDRFDEAYSRFPNAVIQFNRAQALRGLGRTVEAAEAFEQFIAEAKSASRDKRAEAEQDLAQLRHNLGLIRIECDVDGAEVLVDGRVLGLTPLAKPVRSGAGTRQLTVRKVGLSAFSQAVDVPPEGERKVTVALTAASPTVELTRIPTPRVAAPEVSSSSSSASADGTVVAARPSPDQANLSHAGQIGVCLRADTKVYGDKGAVLVAGLSYGIGARFEVALTALIGQLKGVAPEARLFLTGGAVKPIVRIGVPSFFNDGLRVGLQPAAGLVFDLGSHVGLAVEASAVYFPSAPAGVPTLLFIPTAGTQIRF